VKKGKREIQVLWFLTALYFLVISLILLVKEDLSFSSLFFLLSIISFIMLVCSGR